MTQSFAFTFVRYKILAMVILSFVFVIIAFSREDWMREEISMKMGPIKKIIKANTGSILNMTSGMIPTSSSGVDPKNAVDAFMKMVPDDATIDLMVHLGLKEFCIKITAKKLGNPLQLAVPVISWCFKNDMVLNPEKYQLKRTKGTKVWGDGIRGILIIQCISINVF